MELFRGLEMRFVIFKFYDELRRKVPPGRH